MKKCAAPKLPDFVAKVALFCPITYKKAYEDVISELLPVWPHADGKHYRVRICEKLKEYLSSWGLEEAEINELLSIFSR